MKKKHESRRYNEQEDKTASSQDSMLPGRLASVGNFIKPMQDITFHGAQA
jgi:hypothetical protein